MVADEMFFSADSRSLRRGRRRNPRTETCRPCMVWPADAPGMRSEGVVMDMHPHGMRIRMVDSMPPGMDIRLQLMRDDNFMEPLTPVLSGRIVRNAMTSGGLTDHGIELKQTEIPRVQEGPRVAPRRATAPLSRPRQRMHTIDYTVGGRRPRNTER